ncbi:MAG: hypothetical protein ACOH2A_11465 [Sphingobacteriaceae bacterium]
MLKKLTFKPEHGLALATGLLLLLSYQLAFKKTFMAYGRYRELRSVSAPPQDLSYQPAYLERKDQNLRRILQSYTLDSVAFRSHALGVITSIAEKVGIKLTGVPVRDPSYHTTLFRVQRLDFEGDYFSMLRMIQLLQSQPGIGVLRSLKFKTTGSNADKNEKLTLEVYMESRR